MTNYEEGIKNWSCILKVVLPILSHIYDFHLQKSFALCTWTFSEHTFISLPWLNVCLQCPYSENKKNIQVHSRKIPTHMHMYRMQN